MHLLATSSLVDPAALYSRRLVLVPRHPYLLRKPDLDVQGAAFQCLAPRDPQFHCLEQGRKFDLLLYRRKRWLRLQGQRPLEAFLSMIQLHRYAEIKWQPRSYVEGKSTHKIVMINAIHVMSLCGTSVLREEFSTKRWHRVHQSEEYVRLRLLLESKHRR